MTPLALSFATHRALRAYDAAKSTASLWPTRSARGLELLAIEEVAREHRARRRGRIVYLTVSQ